LVVAIAAALLIDAASAQQPTRRSAYRVAQTRQLESPEGLTNLETLPDGYQIPLRQSEDGLVIQAEDGYISLAARGAEVVDVLTALAELQGLNLITQETVTGTLNTTLNRVPIQDALDVILEMTGHTWTRNKNIILVTSIAEASTLSPETQGRQVKVFELDYVAADDVSAVVTTMLSPVGTVSVVSSSGDDNRRTQELLVVEDLPRYLASIDNYVRQHDIPPRQVMIEAYILQVELSDDMKHGVNFDHMFGMTNSLFQLEGRNFASATGTQGFFVNMTGAHLGGLVEMLETAVDAKTLASPKVRVLNGQTARLQVGEQLGFRVTTVTETAATESVQFLDVGVVLEVTPRIAADGTVVMRVRPEVSSGEVNPNTGLPEEETTELETDVMFQNNQAFIIGGLIQETNNDSQAKVPWLGDWHHFGRLFQRREATKRRSEIIIALLPRVMPFDHMANQQYQVETERTQTPLLYGALEEFPRPWEPQLPDAGDNPAVRLPRHWQRWFQRDNDKGKGADHSKSPTPADRFELAPEHEKMAPSPEDVLRPAQVYTSQRSLQTTPVGRIRMTRLPPTRQGLTDGTRPPGSPSIRHPAPGTMLR
jgi:type II secretory pathway component GspD/PulD (secretin)